MGRYETSEAETILDKLLDLWTTPGIGWGQVEDMLNNLAIRRDFLVDCPNAFDPEVLNPWIERNAWRRLKLDPDKAIDMRARGMRYRDIAKEMNCSVGLVHKMVNGYNAVHRKPFGKMAYESHGAIPDRPADLDKITVDELKRVELPTWRSN